MVIIILPSFRGTSSHTENRSVGGLKGSRLLSGYDHE